MSWLDIHRSRLSREGETIKEAHQIQSTDFIEANFRDSPTYNIVSVEEEEIEVRIISDRRYSISSGYVTKKLLLKPEVEIPRGSIVDIDDEEWLALYYDYKILSPKCYIRLCNKHLDFGNGVKVPCVAGSRRQTLQMIDVADPIDLPAGKMEITAPYNEHTKEIRETDRFVIDSIAWEVHDYDTITQVVDGQGLIELLVKKVPLKEDELPTDKPTDDIIKDDYHIEVFGNNRVKVKCSSSYEVRIYKDGVEIDGDVTWSVTKGSIDSNGRFTAPKDKCEVEVTAIYKHIEDYEDPLEISVSKIVEIYEDNGWEW